MKIRQHRWVGFVAVLAASLASSVPAAKGQTEMPMTPEPFTEIPDDLYTAAENAIAEFEWLSGASVEYVVVTTDKGSKIFKFGDIPEAAYKLEEIQDSAAGKVVMIPRWSSKTGTELIDPVAEDVQQFIIISTESPGSGSDCRRGGSCRGANPGG